MTKPIVVFEILLTSLKIESYILKGLQNYIHFIRNAKALGSSLDR